MIAGDRGTEEYRGAAGDDDDQTNEEEAEKANQDQEPTPRKNVDWREKISSDKSCESRSTFIYWSDEDLFSPTLVAK